MYKYIKIFVKILPYKEYFKVLDIIIITIIIINDETMLLKIIKI